MFLKFITGALLAVTVSSAARANDWEKFFHPVPAGTLPLEDSVAPPTVDTVGPDAEAAVAKMWEQGYTIVGYSEFTSPRSNTADAVKLATKMKAHTVLISTNLDSSRTVSMPLTLPTTTTATTNGNISVYGSGGSAQGSYNGTTTYSGTSTTYFPITINRFSKLALFFKSVGHLGSGIFARPLTAEQRASYQTNQGVVVFAVRENSPAYKADVLPGDVILAVDGNPAGTEVWRGWLSSLVNTKVNSATLTLMRNGQKRDIVMPIAADWQPVLDK